MLKECSPKKYGDLQKSIQSYLDSTKGIVQQPTSIVNTQAGAASGDARSVTLDKFHINVSHVQVVHLSTAKDGQTVDGSQSIPQTSEKTSMSSTITAALASAGHNLDVDEAELVLQPLRLAFETKNLKLVEPALNCLHKLIAYDHLEGDPGLDGGKNSPLFTDILNMVCGCVDNSPSDSTILQVLKVLLTAVASTKFRVHGEPLLAVIRVCNNIALNSKSPINQATSKAMLTQMVSIIFRRMESDQHISNVSEGTEKSLPDTDRPDAETSSGGDLDANSEKGVVLGDVLSVNTPIASVEDLQNLAGGADIKGLEAVLDNAVHIEDGKKITREIDLDSMSIGQRDALLLLRTLCKTGSSIYMSACSLSCPNLSFNSNSQSSMAVKEETDEVTTKTRLLSLELLQGLLEGVSHTFTKNFHFIDLVKAYLSYALLRASISPSPIIFQYATGIFVVLLLRFRESLKGEIGVFFPLIVLRSLDSSDSPLNQRTSVLRMLEKGCKDPQMLVDIFVNYDCDLEVPNLFERMCSVKDSPRSQGTFNSDPNNASQTTSIKGSSLQKWEDVPSSFEKAKAHKSTMEAAISEFNRHPGKGIGYLITNNLVERTPASVAQFLRNTNSLDKAMIGDYLGQHEEFPLSVMHAYVDAMKFSGMKFDSAIREFLRGFRLPGEAQKIDRIMEKFAERYCADHPGLFKNADTAYILAYAVIMLNTDAHNPMVWPKMSKSEHKEIYDSIINEEIKMKHDLPGTGKGSKKPETEERGRLVNILNLALPRRKTDSDVRSESEDIVKHTQAFLRKQGEKRGVFHTAQQIELVRPMVEAVGWPLLATFSVTMEEGDYKPRVTLCMEGFRAGIHITRALGMDTMRYAFLTSLVSKNVEALKTFLTLCDLERDSLEDTWNAVLECVSRLEFITSTPSISASVMMGSNQISKDAVLQSLKELAGKPSEQVFVNSVKLPSDSVVEFFTALCGISAEELKQTPARVFSLQKVVEISYYNMAQIRLVWARIWCVLANHFISAGSHHDEKIAMYAIDSLRQLGMKYLERMIKSKVGNIKSGWRSVFMIFTAAADDEVESIVESAFENVEQVILEHFDQVVGDCFMDCVNCLIGFAKSKSSHRISLKAIALLRICEDRLAEGLILGGALKPVDANADTAFDVTEHYWFPMLAGLSDLTSDPRLEVRNCALEVLFDLLNERGRKFSSAFWESIFHRVLFPIFDHVQHAGKESIVSSGDDWILETSVHSLQLLCNLFNTFYKEVCFMLPPLLGLLLDCAKKTDRSVVSLSLGALVYLIEVGGHQFSDSDWDTLLKCIRDASYATQPVELLNSLRFDNTKSNMVLARGLEVNIDDNASGRHTDNGHMDSPGRYFGQGSPGIGNDSPGRMTSPYNLQGNLQELESRSNLKESEGLPSPSGQAQKPAVGGSLQRSQTLGQRIMGNMMDNLLLRNLTSKSKILPSDTAGLSCPVKMPNVIEPDSNAEEESPLLTAVRAKGITQLLLGAIDSNQFAASYNSYTNLRMRMHHIPSERPPLNLLGQELAGTCIYLDMLQKTTTKSDTNTDKAVEANALSAVDGEETLDDDIAEEKLVSFCGQILKEASDLQSGTGDAASVLNGMCLMNRPIFRKHLREFYPLFMKLVCCDQMDVRGALGDPFNSQLTVLLP
ncbi:hypothetical protein MKW92_017070 [Papaver armeniacum]|nr:hypothetical protein MKW92_017070 [Papaver armeniacum]